LTAFTPDSYAFSVPEITGGPTTVEVGTLHYSTPGGFASITFGNDDGHFAVQDDGNGTLTLTATDLDYETQPHSYNLTVELMDNITFASATATVTVDVTDVNEPPGAFDMSFDVVEQRPFTFDPTVGAPMAGSIDPEGAPVSVSVIDGPLYGQIVTNNDGTVTYTASPTDTALTDTVTYAFSDGVLESLPFTMTFHVQPITLSVDVAADSDLDLVLVDQEATSDTEASVTYTQLLPVSISVGLPGDIASDYTVKLQFSSSIRVWANPDRTNEIAAGDPLDLYGMLNRTVYVEGAIGGGTSNVEAQLLDSGNTQVKNKQKAVSFDFKLVNPREMLDGVVDVAKTQLINAVGSQFDDGVCALQNWAQTEIGNLNPADPTQAAQIQNLNTFISDLNGTADQLKDKLKNEVFDREALTVKLISPFGGIVSRAAGEAADNAAAATTDQWRPAVQLRSIGAMLDNTDLQNKLNDVKSGNFTAALEAVGQPDLYIQKATIARDFTTPSGKGFSVEVGVFNLPGNGNWLQNTYGGVLTFLPQQWGIFTISGAVGIQYTPHPVPQSGIPTVNPITGLELRF
jgi:hypothetical protein